MKAEYEVVVKFKITHEINAIEGLKSNSEFAEDLCHMVADEATSIDAVAEYEVLESSVKVLPRYCSIHQGCPNDLKICCCDCNDTTCNVPMYLECFPNTCNLITYEEPQ